MRVGPLDGSPSVQHHDPPRATGLKGTSLRREVGKAGGGGWGCGTGPVSVPPLCRRQRRPTRELPQDCEVGAEGALHIWSEGQGGALGTAGCAPRRGSPDTPKARALVHHWAEAEGMRLRAFAGSAKATQTRCTVPRATHKGRRQFVRHQRPQVRRSNSEWESEPAVAVSQSNCAPGCAAGNQCRSRKARHHGPFPQPKAGGKHRRRPRPSAPLRRTATRPVVVGGGGAGGGPKGRGRSCYGTKLL